MIDIRTGTANFPNASNSGPQVISNPVPLPGNIVKKPDGSYNVGVFLSGFDLHYASDDHHILKAIAKVEANVISPNQVNVTCTLGLRDSSGEWDDAYAGYIAYTLIAEIK